MSQVQQDAVSVARSLADALELHGIPYAVGGAIAYGYFGAARGTKDVDLNLFLSAEAARPALEVLVKAGLKLDIDSAIQSGVARGDAVGFVGLLRVDLFFNSIDLHERAAQRTREVLLLDRPIRVLAPEDTVIFKAFFNRGKDWVDIERVVGRQGTALDRAEVRRWLVDGVGEGDERVLRWDDLCAKLPVVL